MWEMHTRICGVHISTNVMKIMRCRYFWPSMREDAKEMVKICDKCQIQSNNHHVSQNKYHYLSSPIPFAQWGMDLLGPFPKARGGKEYLVVAIDYITC